MDAWYKIARLRREVREGRSFNPDEFAIALEQVVAGTAPGDYSDPAQFFARNWFTRALRQHTGMVLRRLAGRTDNTAPVLTLITQFGGGKTHTLTTLYHLVTNAERAAEFPGVPNVLSEAGLRAVPAARVAVFVGNAWDPREGRETPWIDVARQLAGDRGVETLGTSARVSPPGTDSLGQLFQAANAPVLVLFDEVLNFLNRHRSLAEGFYAFIQNLTVAMTGTTHGAAVISLPRSQVEMTAWDMEWQDRIAKVVRRVARDLIANDETEISEVVRRRLFEDLGSERTRRAVATAFANWCFERRAQLPPEWTAVDTATTEAGARELLRARFEACYPFHPATLSVFQRKWQALPQYQQTRGTLAMLAQWIAIASRDDFSKARTEPLITLGSAPLYDPGFRSTVLGQLGESRLLAAIEADIAGDHSRAKALDADTKGPLRDIHRRVGTAILFESSGGQTEKVAHLPELRFALGEPNVDTTSIDNAALALEAKCYFIRRVGSDGFRIQHEPTIRKVVSDRRASLDPETEIKPALRKLVDDEFRRGATIPVAAFPADSTDIPDTPKLTLVVADPDTEWAGSASLRQQVADWTAHRGAAARLYPGALVWCVRKPGPELRERVELWLAWSRVLQEGQQGLLGDRFDRDEAKRGVADALSDAKDQVWGGYRYAVILDHGEADGLKVIDLGAGHSSSGESLCDRVITALKSEALLSESVGAGYLDRNWPPALKESGAWPLASLRQSFLNGSLTRLLDPDTTLRRKIVEFVGKGEFGLASGQNPAGTYERVWFEEPVAPEEIVFQPDVFLLTKGKARALRKAPQREPGPQVEAVAGPGPTPGAPTEEGAPVPAPRSSARPRQIRLAGNIPPELWNRLGTRVLPKLRSGSGLTVSVGFSVVVTEDVASGLASDLQQILSDLGLANVLRIEQASATDQT